MAHRQNRHGGYTKRLIKYCLYAWGSPVLFVAACVITDYVKEGSIGYGKCYKSKFEKHFISSCVVNLCMYN